MPAYALAILAIGWVAWFTPFFLTKRSQTSAKTLDRRARWGILLEVIGYSLLWQTRFWERPLPAWRTALSIIFFALAALLSWTAPRALGRQWRIDAALNPDHQLVTSGPYRLVRHPIYTSMLCLLLGMGFLVAPLPLLLLSTLVFIAGTEIRVRIEDRLLASQFGDHFHHYQRTVPAYIPFLK
jgi:protein-S-isoprenylcysteine O-methyltransferase Ste14